MKNTNSIHRNIISEVDFDKPIKLKVPRGKSERDRLMDLVKKHVALKHYTPPLSIEELSHHTEILMTDYSIPEEFSDLITVLINNEVWKSTVAAVPFERRVLLIPQCLRSSKSCPAEMDEFGLLCQQCSSCSIGLFQARAEELGYVVLVAEGTTVVTKLIESGKVDAVIGISCLSVLEKTFPHMASGAVPGIAIPLISDGCTDTVVDSGWVMDAINLQTSAAKFEQIDIPSLHAEVKHWFEYDNLVNLLGKPKELSEDIAFDWLIKSGKRWRPLLLAAVSQALQSSKELSLSIQKLALAVECFHKASLIHDDIEDSDDVRYGEKSLHIKHGIAIALNTGDLLLGEGYRMIAECGAEAEKISKMLHVAVKGHKSLCLGQGEELLLEKAAGIASSDKLIEVFKWKTSPAFEVALQLGAIYAGADKNICRVLKEFSESLGIAYQIKDDLEDFNYAKKDSDISHLRSSLVFVLAAENAQGKAAKYFQDVSFLGKEIFNFITEMNIEEKAHQLEEHYKNRAVRSLAQLQNANLKSLMRKIITRILK